MLPDDGLECLWLARTMPFPFTSGDRIYTGKLVAAFAATGVRVTFVGLAGTAPPQPMEKVSWHVVPGGPRRQLAAVLSTMPLVAARHATTSYRREVAHLVGRTHWDVVVMDQYGMGWVDRYLPTGAARPCTVFIGHDHEEHVTWQQWQAARPFTAKAAFLLQNHLKTRAMERRTIRASDVVTAISQQDATSYAHTVGGAHVVTLTPGYDGPVVAERRITETVPRAVVVFGSFRWSAKHANLLQLLDAASARLTAAGIELRIVGDMDAAMRAELSRRYPATVFTGFVADPAPFLDARLAIVAEPVGGGFKLKLLDYLFRRIPIVALEASVAGLPEAVLRHLMLEPDLPGLVDRIVSVIDDTEALDAAQAHAYAAARRAFAWSDRGRCLRSAVDASLASKTHRGSRVTLGEVDVDAPA